MRTDIQERTRCAFAVALQYYFRIAYGNAEVRKSIQLWPQPNKDPEPAKQFLELAIAMTLIYVTPRNDHAENSMLEREVDAT